MPAAAIADLVERAAAADAAHAVRYPGAAPGRQPVHTVYVPADRFDDGTVTELGADARQLLDAHAPDGATLAGALGVDVAGAAADRLRERVAAKLAADPVEDLRVDFEDGYGHRDDADEDADAASAAQDAAAGGAPARFGIRVKPFCDGLAARSARTLDVFLTALLEATDGELPDGFVVTFPKVLGPEYVEAFVSSLERLESALGLPAASLRFEIQVETTQSIVDRDGRLALPALVEAAAGRCVGAHFGTFDYTAAVGLAPAEQRITHPACDFARHVMQTCMAGTGVRLSDGSTNVVPASDATADVHAAWRRHASEVRHSLAHGFFQGWDLHAAQLPSRFGAVFAYLLADLDAVCDRLAAWHRGGGSDGVLDEPATVKALLGQLRRAVDCGAIPADEAAERSGVALEELAR